jgi:hypothetical protein
VTTTLLTEASIMSAILLMLTSSCKKEVSVTN